MVPFLSMIECMVLTHSVFMIPDCTVRPRDVFAFHRLEDVDGFEDWFASEVSCDAVSFHSIGRS